MPLSRCLVTIAQTQIKISEYKFVEISENAILNKIIESNKNYASKFSGLSDSGKPNMRLAILTCMDCRINPYSICDLTEGDVHIVRNAGARVTEDAIRSLVISHKFMETTTWCIIHHTQCGMHALSEHLISDLLKDDLESAEFADGEWKNPIRKSSKNTKPGSTYGEHVHWFTFEEQEETLLADISVLRNHPLVPSHIDIFGFIFDIDTGNLRLVE